MGKRLFTVFFGIIIFVAIFWLDSEQLIVGPFFFNISSAIVSLLMCHELYKALESKGFKPIKILGYLGVLFLVPIGIFKSRTIMIDYTFLIPVLFFIGMAIPVFTKLKYSIMDVAATLIGDVYIIFMFSFLCATRALPLGEFLIFYIICGAWFSDIFAYLFGRLLGKHKFSEISPNKSVEGCVAGVFGTVIFFVIYSLILGSVFARSVSEVSQSSLQNDTTIQSEISFTEEESKMDVNLQKYFYSNYPLLIGFGVLISIISQVGDLIASGIKRYCEIKDFSHLMPGHGGMLDRFDSVLFVSPIMYYVFYFIYSL